MPTFFNISVCVCLSCSPSSIQSVKPLCMSSMCSKNKKTSASLHRKVQTHLHKNLKSSGGQSRPYIVKDVFWSPSGHYAKSVSASQNLKQHRFFYCDPHLNAVEDSTQIIQLSNANCIRGGGSFAGAQFSFFGILLRNPFPTNMKDEKEKIEKKWKRKEKKGGESSRQEKPEKRHNNNHNDDDYYCYYYHHHHYHHHH